MTNERRSKPPRYVPSITLGNILTMAGMVIGGLTWMMTDHDKLITVQAAQISSDQRDTQFRHDVIQRLSDLQTDIREIRTQTGVNWRELPPSRYAK